ncbi:peptidase M23 [Streptomyces cellostaticus]|uniref:Peptidase M23 n=1 Tax=Streptomyces cellostaticus TaxID=67285 RepID=A0A117PXB0_9ACTN|nr:M23 family metallopeptidase [Streptomyces cellostaticus]KUM96697.1 peptidase M23 [Streptomyces cellostaticus]GHI05515.1 peptidase [Streptomyces cellostaticus]
MNDRHPSGTMTTPAPASDASAAHYASYGAQEAPYDDLTTYGSYDATGFAATGTGAFGTDPLFGGLPGQQQHTGAYDTTQWQTGTGQQPLNYDPYAAQHHAAYDSGVYDTTAWTVPAQATGNDISGQWDASAWLQPDQPAGTDPTQQWEWGTQTFDTGTYDATQWNSDGSAAAHAQLAEPFDQQATATFEQVAYENVSPDEFGEYGGFDTPAEEGESGATGELPVVPSLLEDQEEATPAPASRAGSRSAARSRRRTPPKRSALLTVAVPSACVMGVAGIAAASVGGLTDDGRDTTASASDTHAVKPSVANSKLDSQLRTLSAGADDFADRASRTQDRIDLKAQQVLEKKKAAAEAALKERLRPKFVLPVTQKGLSAYFGQAGVNWMSVHTGIDFPVAYGTTVMSATDGTVTTKWNSAYGNMLIVTAMDGTETWYCHLSSYRVPSGTTVKAGEPIAFSGNSGNSTGPHLHFEVRPAGGAAIDPLPWLRSHGLDPT